ncbi:MAG: phytanoyl-CoA dioxygenase family protein, partial [Myxococcota bacterium]
MTVERAEAMRENGYVGWPNAVPADRVRRAVHLINRNIGEKGIDPAQIPAFENTSYCPDLRDHPDILALFNGTSLQAQAEHWLGPLAPAARAQIALRFPRPDRPPNGPHLDGVAAPHNGLAAGTIKTFSLLACVYLSEVLADGGALNVWPGSHLRHAEYFAEHGPKSLLSGMPPVTETEPPVALTGGAGHGFLVHYLTGHAVGSHFGANLRYAVFF